MKKTVICPIEIQICDRLYKLKRYIEFIVRGPRVETEDIYGDAIVRIWEFIRKGKFKEGLSIDAFMYRCAKSATCDYYGKKNKTKRIHSDEYDHHFDNSTKSYEKEYEALIRTEIFMKQIEKKLSAVYRKILILSLFQSMKHYEIAEILGIPRGTISTYLFRMRKQLGNIHLNKIR